MCLRILYAWMGPYVLQDNHPIYRAHEKRVESSKKHAREHRTSRLLSGCGGLSPPTTPRSRFRRNKRVKQSSGCVGSEQCPQTHLCHHCRDCSQAVPKPRPVP